MRATGRLVLVLAVLAGATASGADSVAPERTAALRTALARTFPAWRDASLLHVRDGRPRGICGTIDRGAAGSLPFWFDDSDGTLWPSVLRDDDLGRLNAEMTRVLVEMHCSERD